MDTHIKNLVSWRAHRKQNGPFIQFKAPESRDEAMKVAEITVGGSVALLYRSPKCSGASGGARRDVLGNVVKGVA